MVVWLDEVSSGLGDKGFDDEAPGEGDIGEDAFGERALGEIALDEDTAEEDNFAGPTFGVIIFGEVILWLSLGAVGSSWFDSVDGTSWHDNFEVSCRLTYQTKGKGTY